MPDSFSFGSTSPRFGLPLLFAGQAQKEHFVNEAHALTDALLHCAVEGTASAPPVSPADGEAWLVGAQPSAEWAGHGEEIACRQGGNWLFVAPRDGLAVFDRASGQIVHFFGGWQFPVAPAEPSGGVTVDTEARAAIDQIIAALRVAGVFTAS